MPSLALQTVQIDDGPVAAVGEAVEQSQVDLVPDRTDRSVCEHSIDAGRVGTAEVIPFE